MYMMTRYADLSGKLDEILKEIRWITSWRVLLFNIFLISCWEGGLRGTWVSEYPLTLLIIQYFNYSVREINSLCEKYKKRIYLIIVLIYNLDGGNKWDINTYEYITNDKWCFFYIGRSIFRSFLTVIFYTFIFVKDEMHVDFLHNQRNTNICICMAFRERLGLTQYLGVHKLCKRCL